MGKENEIRQLRNLVDPYRAVAPATDEVGQLKIVLYCLI